MRMFSIASGSSGNCIYIGNESTHLLVDAGVSGKRIIQGLEQMNLSLSDMDGILITHEHTDHIQGLGILLRKCEIPVYATADTIEEIFRYDKLGKVNRDLFSAIEPDHTFSIRDMFIQPASIWHDAADPVCYSFLDASGKISIATDLGDFDEYLIHRLNGSDVVLVESNHDVRMLEANRTYSYALKQRILGKRGHLSNERSGELMTRLVSNYKVKSIVLGHLSRENNIPECAFINMQNYMRQAGLNLEQTTIEVARRDCCSADISI